MEQKRTIQRKQSKKKKRPKVRFNFWVMFIIFALSFIGCFVLYMLAANFNDDFFKDEFEDAVIEMEHYVPESTTESSATTTESEQTAMQDSITNPVPQSALVNPDYFDNASLISDSTLKYASDYSKFSEANIFCSSELNASNCSTLKINSSFGNDSLYDIIKNKKPAILYIMLGSDIETSSVDDMITSYKTLVSNIHSALPDTKVYVMQLPPVIYDTETLTNEMINNYNDRLLEMCNETGIYCIDTNTALKAENGVLKEEYYSYDTLSISAAGYSKICEYIVNHVA
ncbi:MAG: hypothetical protein K2K91_11815 [Ruminococcus sp.]|nr:hypothetical protein [Ruminococcus sp.]MDE7098323.1 hypothetical protein [Ruminococcus sp.]